MLNQAHFFIWLKIPYHIKSNVLYHALLSVGSNNLPKVSHSIEKCDKSDKQLRKVTISGKFWNPLKCDKFFCDNLFFLEPLASAPLLLQVLGYG